MFDEEINRGEKFYKNKKSKKPTGFRINSFRSLKTSWTRRQFMRLRSAVTRPFKFVGRQLRLATMDTVEVSVKLPEADCGEEFVSFEVFADYPLACIATSSGSAFSFRAPRGMNLYFAGRTGRGRPVGINPKALAFGRAESSEESRALTVVENEAQKAAVGKLGFRLLNTRPDEIAIFRGRGGVESVVGVHLSPPKLVEHLLSSNGAAANPPWFTVQTVSARTDTRRFNEAITRAGRGLKDDSPVLGIQELVGEMFAPSADDQLRFLVVTAPASHVLNRALNAKTGLAGAKPLTVRQWANLAYAIQMAETWDRAGDILGDDPYRLALPKVIWDQTMAHVPALGRDVTVVYVELAVTTPDTWASLLSLPGVDAILNIENPGSREPLRARCLARLRGDAVMVRRAFNSLPHPKRLVPGVMGLDVRHLERTHYACLPGMPKMMAGLQYTLHEWEGSLHSFSAATDAQGNAAWDLPLGRNGAGRVVGVDSSLIFSGLITGTSGQGKTVYTLAQLAFARTKNVALIHWAKTKQAWTQELFAGLGGFSMPFNDARKLESPEDFQAAVRKIKEAVRTRADEIIAQSRKAKRLVGFPCVFHIVEGNKFLYLAWCLEWIEALGRITEVAKELGEEMVIIADDIIAAATPVRDVTIGDEAENLGKRVQTDLHTFANTCRHNKARLYITVQGFASFVKCFGVDFFEDIPLALSVSRHSHVTVWEPGSTELGALAAYEQALSDARKNDPSAELDPGDVPGFRFSLGYEYPSELLQLLHVPES